MFPWMSSSISFVVSLFPFFSLHFKHSIFSYSKFHTYILAVDSNSMYLSFSPFFILVKYLYVTYIQEYLKPYNCVQSLNADESSSSFFSWHTESMLSLWCKTLYIVLCSLVLLSICRNSFLVHFKKDPEYLTRKTAHALWLDFCSLVSRGFLVLRYSFNSFFFSSSFA